MGLGAQVPSTFSQAIKMAAKVFQYGQELGFHFTMLDIGGGFPGRTELQGLFLEIAGAVNKALDQHFSEYPEVNIIAEPGIATIRFIVNLHFVLV